MNTNKKDVNERYVIFRTLNKSKAVIALFPTISTTDDSEVESYSLMTGSANVNYGKCILQSSPSDYKEYYYTLDNLRKSNDDIKFVVRLKRPYKKNKHVRQLPFDFYKQ